MKTAAKHLVPGNLGRPVLEIDAVQGHDKVIPVFTEETVDVNGAEFWLGKGLESVCYSFMRRFDRSRQDRGAYKRYAHLPGLAPFGPDVPGHVLQTQDGADTVGAQFGDFSRGRRAASAVNAGLELVDNEGFSMADAPAAQHQQ